MVDKFIGGHQKCPPINTENKMENSENLSKKYFDELQQSDKPGIVLARFYCESTGVTNSLEVIKSFNKLITMYGRYAVYNAILNVYDMPNVNYDNNTYPLLSYFCKKEISKISEINIDLTDIIKDREKKLDTIKKKKLKIPNPFESDIYD